MKGIEIQSGLKAGASGAWSASSASSARAVCGAAVALALAFGPVQVQAQLYKHVDEKGRVIYSDAPPTTNNEVKTLTKQGRVSGKQDAELTAEQLRQKEQEVARKKEQDRLFNEQRRRDLTLLATYTSERDIEVALTRNIDPINNRTKSASERLTALEQKEQQIADEMEFYKAGKRRGKETKVEVPADLVAQSKAVTREREQLKLAIEGNEKEIVGLKERFALDKSRWQNLRKGTLPGHNPEPQFQMAEAPALKDAAQKDAAVKPAAKR
jgi:hypothetical protein